MKTKLKIFISRKYFLSEKHFHLILKIAKFVPVHKKGSKLDFLNYRPISLLSNTEKI